MCWKKERREEGNWGAWMIEEWRQSKKEGQHGHWRWLEIANGNEWNIRVRNSRANHMWWNGVRTQGRKLGPLLHFFCDRHFQLLGALWQRHFFHPKTFSFLKQPIPYSQINKYQKYSDKKKVTQIKLFLFLDAIKLPFLISLSQTIRLIF